MDYMQEFWKDELDQEENELYIKEHVFFDEDF